VFTVVFEARPANAARLRALVLDMKEAERVGSPSFAHLRQAVPSLHFMSVSVCADNNYDPMLVIEVNFDGRPGWFWGQLEAALGPRLREMLRCCKTPAAGWGSLFAAVTAPGSRAPLAPLFEAAARRPAAFHQGNRGLTCARIQDEAALFLALRTLADDVSLRAEAPVAIHGKLRGNLLPDFPWLSQTPPARVGVLEGLRDFLRFVVHLALIIAVLVLPAGLLALGFPSFRLPAALALVAMTSALRLRDLDTLDGRASPATWLAALLALAVGVAPIPPKLAAVLAAVAVADHVAPFWAATLIAGAVASALSLLVWVRLLERADPALDAPHPDPRIQAEISRTEDCSPLNHMVSTVAIKPGILRAILIRVGLRTVRCFLGFTARTGYLGTLRTIHFANWTIVSGGGRLLFNTNYDGSWESYLDDFIEKTRHGLTLAWTSTVGFPRTRMLLGHGAQQGRLFKAWARNTMSQSLFWYSAYALTVDQIERNVRLANGLRKASLSPKEAAQWLVDV
jgi:hypothetical protein